MSSVGPPPPRRGPTDPPTKRDPKEVVAAGYDACGARYTAARSSGSVALIQRLLGSLPARPRVLDVGCGAGIPVAALLARHADVTGVDLSEGQVREARRRVPAARFVTGDVLEQDFEPASFDAIVALYVLFHLPREEHAALLRLFRRWLRPEGTLLATLTDVAHPGYTRPDFFGVPMYWSHFDAPWYLAGLRELGFSVVDSGALGHGYGGDARLPEERHPFVLARRGEVRPAADGRAAGRAPRP